MARRRKAFTKKRRRRGYARRAAAGARRAYRRYKKGRGARMGMIGKAGVALAGGVPVGLAAVDALEPWVNPLMAPLSLADKLRHSIAGPTNNLTTGFGLGAALPTGFGGLTVVNSMVGSPGGYLKTTAAGLGLVVVDGVIGMIFKFTGRAKAARAKIFGRQLISG